MPFDMTSRAVRLDTSWPSATPRQAMSRSVNHSDQAIVLANRQRANVEILHLLCDLSDRRLGRYPLGVFVHRILDFHRRLLAEPSETNLMTWRSSSALIPVNGVRLAIAL
jgi:hypothetical protein